MKKKLTAKQIEKAKANRARLVALSNKIAAMDEDTRKAFAAKAAGVATIEGHELSPRNAMIVMLQKADATLVGGCRQWGKAGRRVRKGEKGLGIWVPTKAKIETAEGEEKETTRFRVFSVFDVSQTEESH